MATNIPQTYICTACGHTFSELWDDDEAKAEYRRDFPGSKDDDKMIVCDDCYKDFMLWWAEEHARN